MNARKFQLKLFTASAGPLAVDAIVPVLHGWIRDRAIPELLIDVTDYDHVHHGPSVLVVGHESDYVLDQAGGRPGLILSRKREFPGDAAATLRDALRRLLTAASLLEAAPTLGGLRFRTDELEIRVNDRLAAPPTDAAFAELSALVGSVLLPA
ncbi:MAG: hypothetical protein FJ104_15695, partial [Deltaproteobacteria bacterium]|nr:hypothetical protein [Deltaproteobacteria bacterium]